MGIILCAALAVLGYLICDDQKCQAENRNKKTEEINCRVNSKVNAAQKKFDGCKKAFDDEVELLGKEKYNILTTSFDRYYNQLKLFRNLCVLKEKDYELNEGIGTFYSTVSLKNTLEKINIESLNGTPNTNVNKNALIASLGVFGTVMVADSLASGVGVAALLGKVSILGCIPLALGAGFAISGIYANSKSKQAYNEAVMRESEANVAIAKVEEACAGLESFAKFTSDWRETIHEINECYLDSLDMLDRIIVKNKKGKSKIDCRKLSEEDLLAFYRISLLSKMVKEIIDKKLVDKNGKENYASKEEMDDIHSTFNNVSRKLGYGF